MRDIDFYSYDFKELLDCHWITFQNCLIEDDHKRDLWGTILSKGFEKKTNRWVLEFDASLERVDQETIEQVLSETLFKIFRLYASGLSSRSLPSVHILLSSGLKERLIEHPIMNFNKIKYFRNNLELYFHHQKDVMLNQLNKHELVE